MKNIICFSLKISHFQLKENLILESSERRFKTFVSSLNSDINTLFIAITVQLKTELIFMNLFYLPLYLLE